MADALGWRWAFYIVGIPGLIAAFLAWRIIEPRRGVFDRENGDETPTTETMGHGSLGKDFRGSVQKLLKIPTYWAIVGALVFSFFCIGGTSFWLPTYLSRAFDLSLTNAGTLSGLVLVISGVVGTVVGGWLADFMQRRFAGGRLFTCMLGFLIGAPLVLVALLIHTLALFITVFIVAAISLNFCTGPLNAVIQDIIAPEIRATALGIALLLAHILGDAAAPTIIGVFSDQFSLGTALLVTAPTFLLLAGLVCLLGLRTVAKDMGSMQEQLHAPVIQD